MRIHMIISAALVAGVTVSMIPVAASAQAATAPKPAHYSAAETLVGQQVGVPAEL